MSLSVKICGINSSQAAEAVIDAGADYAGLVFYPGSKRHLGLDEARSLAGIMRGRLRIVALMVDPDDAAIEAVVQAVRPDFLQLHGKEDADRIGAVRAKFKVPIIKALGLADAADLDHIRDIMQVSNMLLFDARPPQDDGVPGGNGVSFDWRMMKGRSFARPWFLAGGLNLDNLSDAVALSGAQCVDVSSGVESAPGVKDPALISAFVAAARAL